MKSMLRTVTVMAIIIATAFAFFTTTNSVYAQDAAATATTADAGAGDAPESDAGDVSFFQIVASSGAIGIIIWVMIFITSAAALGLIIDAFITIKASKIMPPELVDTLVIYFFNAFLE